MSETRKHVTALSQAEIDFLQRVSRGQKLKSADRAQDKVRQKFRELGLVEVRMNPRRWVLTDAGIENLESRK